MGNLLVTHYLTIKLCWGSNKHAEHLSSKIKLTSNSLYLKKVVEKKQKKNLCRKCVNCD